MEVEDIDDDFFAPPKPVVQPRAGRRGGPSIFSSNSDESGGAGSTNNDGGGGGAAGGGVAANLTPFGSLKQQAMSNQPSLASGGGYQPSTGGNAGGYQPSGFGGQPAAQDSSASTSGMGGNDDTGGGGAYAPSIGGRRKKNFLLAQPMAKPAGNNGSIFGAGGIFGDSSEDTAAPATVPEPSPEPAAGGYQPTAGRRGGPSIFSKPEPAPEPVVEPIQEDPPPQSGGYNPGFGRRGAPPNQGAVQEPESAGGYVPSVGRRGGPSIFQRQEPQPSQAAQPSVQQPSHQISQQPSPEPAQPAPQPVPQPQPASVAPSIGGGGGGGFKFKFGAKGPAASVSSSSELAAQPAQPLAQVPEQSQPKVVESKSPFAAAGSVSASSPMKGAESPDIAAPMKKQSSPRQIRASGDSKAGKSEKSRQSNDSVNYQKSDRLRALEEELEALDVGDALDRAYLDDMGRKRKPKPPVGRTRSAADDSATSRVDTGLGTDADAHSRQEVLKAYKQVEEYRKENMRLKVQIDKYRNSFEEIARLKNLVAEKVQVIQTLEKERVALHKLHKQYQKERFEQDNLEEEYTEKVRRVNEDLRVAKARCSKYREIHQELEKQVANQTEKVQELEKSNRDLKAKVKALSGGESVSLNPEKVKAKMSEKDELIKKLEHENSVLKKAAEINEKKAKTKLKDAQSSKHDLLEHNKLLERQVENKNKELRETQIMLKKQQSQMKRMKLEYNNMRALNQDRLKLDAILDEPLEEDTDTFLTGMDVGLDSRASTANSHSSKRPLVSESGKKGEKNAISKFNDEMEHKPAIQASAKPPAAGPKSPSVPPAHRAINKPKSPADLAGFFANAKAKAPSGNAGLDMERLKKQDADDSYHSLLSPSAKSVLDEARSWRQTAGKPNSGIEDLSVDNSPIKAADDIADEVNDVQDNDYDDDDFEEISVMSSRVGTQQKGRGDGDARNESPAPKAIESLEDFEQASNAETPRSDLPEEDMDLLLAGLTDGGEKPNNEGKSADALLKANDVGGLNLGKVGRTSSKASLSNQSSARSSKKSSGAVPAGRRRR